MIGTASPRHHDALRALGVEPIDYRDPTWPRASGNWLPTGWAPCSTTLAAPASPAHTGCSTAPAPWSLTASPASSMTPARCCPASCGCWRNWRSGTTCPRASTRASTTRLGGCRKAGLSQAGSVPGPAAHRSHALVRPVARRRAHREDRRPLPAGRSGRGHGTGRVLRPDRPRQDHPGALTAAPSQPANQHTGRNPTIRRQSQRARAGSATRLNSGSRAERMASRRLSSSEGSHTDGLMAG